jgi:hypothetical protein
MPRLSDEAIKQGILHPDVDVRGAALRYFADALGADRSVMPVVVEALDRYGRTGAFRLTFPVAQLAQSESTVRWAVEELKAQPRRTDGERDYLAAVSGLLVHADPRLVQTHETDILAAPAFVREDRERLTRRLEYLAWDDDALWRELDTVCEEGKDKEYAGDMRWADGLDLVEEIARRGDRQAGRAMDLLAVKVDDPGNNPFTWMEPLAVRLAGELRLEAAIPLLVDKLHRDAEVVSEECQAALVRIGTDVTIHAVQDAYPTAEWHFRLYASGVLGRIHTDPAVTACIELLGHEKDLDLQTWLAQSLVDHFSTEGNEVARRVVLDDPDQLTLKYKLVTACTLMGQDFSELQEWREEMLEARRPKPYMFGGPLRSPPVARTAGEPKAVAPIRRGERRVGRNDPCSCGSGKKFKQCCLRK